MYLSVPLFLDATGTCGGSPDTVLPVNHVSITWQSQLTRAKHFCIGLWLRLKLFVNNCEIVANLLKLARLNLPNVGKGGLSRKLCDKKWSVCLTYYYYRLLINRWKTDLTYHLFKMRYLVSIYLTGRLHRRPLVRNRSGSLYLVLQWMNFPIQRSICRGKNAARALVKDLYLSVWSSRGSEEKE